MPNICACCRAQFGLCNGAPYCISGFYVAGSPRLLRHRGFTLGACIAALALYIGVIDASVSNADFAHLVRPVLPGLQLGYAYLIGVTLFLWQDKLRLNLAKILIASIIITGLTCGFYLWLPWSSLLEVMGVFVWLTNCLGFLYSAPRSLRTCPRLAPMLYVCIWPAAQIVVYMTPDIPQYDVIGLSIALSVSSAGILFILLSEARIQPARL